MVGRVVGRVKEREKPEIEMGQIKRVQKKEKTCRQTEYLN